MAALASDACDGFDSSVSDRLSTAFTFVVCLFVSVVCVLTSAPARLYSQDGKFRWNRFDNLLREGSKSQDFDAGQLWLLAGWILSPNAAAVRATIATELAKMLDAAAAADVRQRLARR